MAKVIKIRTKITSLLLSVVFLSIAAMSYLFYLKNKETVEKRYAESFAVIGKLKSSQIENKFQEINFNLAYLRKSPEIIRGIERIHHESNHESVDYLEKTRFLDSTIIPICNIYNYKNFYITDIQQRLIYKAFDKTVEPRLGVLYPPFEQVINGFLDSTTFGEPFRRGNEVLMYIATPVFNYERIFIGNIIVSYDISANIYPLITDSIGMGRTGEILLSRKVGNSVRILSPMRHNNAQVLSKVMVYGDPHFLSVQKAALGNSSDYGHDIDYRNQEVLAYWTFIPNVHWGIIIKQDLEEINQDLDNLTKTFIQFGSIILLLSFFIAVMFSNYLTKPIASLRDRMELVAQGILPENIEVKSNDEIGQMGRALVELVTALKRTTEFTYQIGQGNFQYDFQPLSKDDALGNALIAMRDNIQSSDQKERERTWIVSGIAEIGQLLRLHDNLEDLGNEIIGFICEKIKAIQGAFYVVDEEKEGEPLIELKAAYAFHKKKYLKTKFRFAEGLVGQAAIEQDKILRTEIPDNYFFITSGILGDKKPKCLLIVPLITNEKVYGVLEFAGFHRFTPTEISFVEEISVIIARTIFNIKVNERTVRLLEESQKMSEELKHQQAILKQNAQVMAETQEELKRANQRLEEQIIEVNRTQKRTQLLLENASEIITIYERDGKIRYISPSVQRILGYTQDEMIGIDDVVYVHAEGKADFKGMFEKLVANPEQKVTIQFTYKRKAGDWVWLEATGTNLLNDAAVQGFVVNTRDITERRRAEKEQRMRSQMQSLSENSPDLITRVNPDGIIFYINPVITQLIGKTPEQLLSLSLKDIQLDPQTTSILYDTIQTVLREKQKVSLEIEFPALDGLHIMQVNAIPEMNDRDNIESVLFVVHDITERKQAELEIRNTNKKITESINYAQRIQSAIMPDSTVIKRVFPNAYMLFKPRDVVSGDFPWLMQKGDDIFVAVADCTGHGVPGALISLIGYFLLRDTVSNYGHLSAGEILDKLDEAMTRTLRQDDESATKTRDGMDIAFCKINQKTYQLEYSGAHRPLLYYSSSDGSLEEIRGNKIPVGGGQLYENDHFTTTFIQLHEGDEIYMFSDGLPDQFGGTTNRKFSLKRIRDIILEEKGRPMEDIKRRFDEEFDSWRGNGKQTDDVLMIGIRF
ncbi:MAG: PAS domain S-box protein [Cytophagales bacterium]|nr:PAS domain S-box protein [Cytophagales bacterium]MDW8383733.1 PAS domain S-box protein [Flammeovirgaceae bacterium]